MDFSKALDAFIERIKSIKDSIATEEATKTALIMPFFSLLGYDVFNPLEFVPEYVADVGTKKGEKVDYAIVKDGTPVVLIEAKSINQKLSKHSGQLYRYFTGTKAKFAILTNGIQYRFYTDLDEPNKMDDIPFNQIDLLNLKSSHIDDLMKFHKASFDVASLLDSASILKHKSTFKELFSAQLEDPSDDFVRLFLQDIYQGMKTQAVVAKFKPILRQAMGELINEQMNDKIITALSATSPGAAPAATPAPVAVKRVDSGEDARPAPAPPQELTEPEQQAFAQFCAILVEYIDPESLTYKKSESNVSFLYQNNARKWICRLGVSGDEITLILPDENRQEIKCRIANFYEMRNYGPYLLSILQRHVTLLQPFDAEHVKLYTVNLTRWTPRRKPRKQARIPTTV